MSGVDEPPDWLRNRGKAVLDEPPDWLRGRAVSGSPEPGASPETAFNEEVPDKDYPGRFGLQNFTTGPAHLERELNRRGFETKDLADGFLRIRSKETGKWYQLEKKGFGGGFLAGAKEAGKDILDVAGDALTLAGQVGGHLA